MKHISFISILFLLLASCNRQNNLYDASGTFEAEEIIISAEATGTIRSFAVQEGQTLKAGEIVGYIDSTQLSLKKKQLQAQINAVLSRKPDVALQLASLAEQLKTAEREQQRINKLFAADAATGKQHDDAEAQVAFLKKQIAAQRSSLGITSSSISEETLPIQAQIEQLNDQLSKCRIANETNGTVLTKYAEAGEAAVAGKPLYKIADLSGLLLRAYITGDQFAQVKLAQPVKVLVDKGDGTMKEYDGVLEWISSKAEFTPKTIQTKDERANLVYAVKIRVKNDGYLKIGMYADVKL